MKPELTPEEIAEIKKRYEAATAGPWMWDLRTSGKSVSLIGEKWPMNTVIDFARYGMSGAAPRFNVDGIMERCDVMAKSYPGKEHHHGFDDYINHPDAEFIAHAITDIPALLSLAESQQAEIEKLREGSLLKDISDRLEKEKTIIGNEDAKSYPHLNFIDGQLHTLMRVRSWVNIQTKRLRPEPPKEG